MTIEEAIKMAIEFENDVRDVYRNAERSAGDNTAQEGFGALGDEEQGHVDYLEEKLKEWQETGTVKAEKLVTIVPPVSVINREIEKLDKHVEKRDVSNEADLLAQALKVEIGASDFYNKMVDELLPEGQALFEPFIQIEEGHQAIVQAELDFLQGTGYWFDFREWDMDG